MLTGSEDGLEPDTRFLEAGLDSLMIVEMSAQIQAEVGSAVDVPATLVFDHPRVCDLAKFLVETFDRSETPTATAASTAFTQSSPTALRDQVDALSEEEALDELLRELETN